MATGIRSGDKRTDATHGDNGRAAAELAATLPYDPAAFVAEAERATNNADFGILDGLYAPDVYFESVIDGAVERYVGDDAVTRAWKAYFSALSMRGLRVRKELLTVTDDAIVNGWRGSIGSGRPVCGVEIWRFDVDGRVCDHRLYGSLSARPSTDWRTRLRLVANAPLTAVLLLGAQLRFGARPNA